MWATIFNTSSLPRSREIFIDPPANSFSQLRAEIGGWEAAHRESKPSTQAIRPPRETNLISCQGTTTAHTCGQLIMACVPKKMSMIKIHATALDRGLRQASIAAGNAITGINAKAKFMRAAPVLACPRLSRLRNSRVRFEEYTFDEKVHEVHVWMLQQICKT